MPIILLNISYIFKTNFNLVKDSVAQMCVFVDLPQVIHATVQDEDFVFSEVYVNDGSVLQAASVASMYNNQLLIGTPEHNLLYCKVEAF